MIKTISKLTVSQSFIKSERSMCIRPLMFQKHTRESTISITSPELKKVIGRADTCQPRPHQLSMILSTSPRFRARRRLTLPVRLSQDIEMVRKYDRRFSRDFPSFYKLSSLADLTAITAEARKKWQQLVNCKL